MAVQGLDPYGQQHMQQQQNPLDAITSITNSIPHTMSYPHQPVPHYNSYIIPPANHHVPAQSYHHYQQSHQERNQQISSRVLTELQPKQINEYPPRQQDWKQVNWALQGTSQLHPEQLMESQIKTQLSPEGVTRFKKGGKRATCGCPNCNLKLQDGITRKHNCHYDNCSKTYGKTSHLRAHLRAHINFRPYSCNYPNCDKKFARSDELSRHCRIHSNDKRFRCAKCDKGFIRSDHLRKHERTHENQRPRGRKHKKTSVDSEVSDDVSSSPASPESVTNVPDSTCRTPDPSLGTPDSIYTSSYPGSSPAYPSSQFVQPANQPVIQNLSQQHLLEYYQRLNPQYQQNYHFSQYGYYPNSMYSTTQQHQFQSYSQS